LRVLPIEPTTANFPFARSLIILRCQRTRKRDALTSTESRYYISSRPDQHTSHLHWDQWIRGHWAGVEIRNHWVRDALMGEDRSRSRNPNLLANLALLRSAALLLLARKYPDQNRAHVRESLFNNPTQCLRLVS
jgi:predicted transposase YbfD/YdcC